MRWSRKLLLPALSHQAANLIKVRVLLVKCRARILIIEQSRSRGDIDCMER